MAGTNKKLIITNKNSTKMPQPEYGTDMRTIEQYAAPGTYASLTGAGETQSPGQLTQVGGFVVLDETGEGIALYSLDGGIVIDNIVGSGVANITLDTSGNIEMGGSAPTGSEPSIVIASDGSLTLQGSQGSGITFSSGSAVTPISVTGSRGGNAALASLLTALDSVGLITDSTTP